MGCDLHLEPVEDDLSYVVELLARNDLPTEDVEQTSARFFRVILDEEAVGIGGIEPCGDVGLLRSVVIDEPYRGNGYGTMVCANLEERAAEQGLRALYLLTTTATPFFRDSGYRRIDRGTAPAQIKATNEFSEYCPTSATCLMKSLE